MNKSTLFSLKAPPTLQGFAKSHSIVLNRAEISDHQRSALRKTVDDYNALPPAKQAALDLIQRIREEERDEHLINPKDIKVEDDTSFTFGGESHPLSSTGFKGIVRSIAPSGALTYLSNIDVDLRAYNLRQLLAKKDKPLKVRTRKGAEGEGREIFSIVGHEYPDVYSDNILETIFKKADPESRGLFKYNPNTTALSFRELTQAPIDVSSYKHSSEEVFKVGREWFLRDDGATSIALSLMMFRQLCANMAILSPDVLNYKKIRHRGEPKAVLGRVERLYDQTGSFTKMFVEKWGASRITQFHANPTVDIVADIYGHLLNRRKLNAYGNDKNVLAACFAQGWSNEPGNTVADLINGVTRYARNYATTNSGPFTARQLESDAGNLLALGSTFWDGTKRF